MLSSASADKFEMEASLVQIKDAIKLAYLSDTTILPSLPHLVELVQSLQLLETTGPRSQGQVSEESIPIFRKSLKLLEDDLQAVVVKRNVFLQTAAIESHINMFTPWIRT